MLRQVNKNRLVSLKWLFMKKRSADHDILLFEQFIKRLV
jgi:hypothetical protein